MSLLFGCDGPSVAGAGGATVGGGVGGVTVGGGVGGAGVYVSSGQHTFG